MSTGGRRGGRRLAAFAQPPDIAPTVLDAAGVEAPDVMQGRSLLPLLLGRARRVRDMAVSSGAITAGKRAYQPSTITTDRWALIYSNPVEKPCSAKPATQGEAEAAERPSTSAVDSVKRVELDSLFPRIQLFDLKADPGQKRDVSRRHADVVRDIHAKYLRFLEGLGTAPDLLDARREL